MSSLAEGSKEQIISDGALQNNKKELKRVLGSLGRANMESLCINKEILLAALGLYSQ